MPPASLSPPSSSSSSSTTTATATSSSSSSSSSYRSRILIHCACRVLEAGDVNDALAFLRRAPRPPPAPPPRSSTTASSTTATAPSSSSSYRSRILIRRAHRALEAGDVDDALAFLRRAPRPPPPLHLHKQRFVELVRRGTEADMEAALDCLRTVLAPCAVDAYLVSAASVPLSPEPNVTAPLKVWMVRRRSSKDGTWMTAKRTKGFLIINVAQHTGMPCTAIPLPPSPPPPPPTFGISASPNPTPQNAHTIGSATGEENPDETLSRIAQGMFGGYVNTSGSAGGSYSPNLDGGLTPF